jgi:hypothetical protein
MLSIFLLLNTFTFILFALVGLLFSHLRGFLTRKRMEFKMKDYKPTTRTKEWARKYKEELKQREDARLHKKNYALIK